MATIILRATEKCNSNCLYCDVVRKYQPGTSMSLETLETVYMRIGEFLTAEPKENIEILWHGGEPLLLGSKYFIIASKLQKKYCSDTEERIHHSIQTNLTCFTEEFVDALQMLGIDSVGTSYDPEPHMRGAGDKIDSEDYNRKFMAAIEILENHNIQWRLIYVVTKRSLDRPLDIFFFLSNLCMTGAVNLNPVLIYDNERMEVALTPLEYADFLGSIFPFWWKYRARYPYTQPFSSLVENLIEGHTDINALAFGVCDSNYDQITIRPNGETTQCGITSAIGPKPFGNLKQRPLSMILRENQQLQYEERDDQLRNRECYDCRFMPLCTGGSVKAYFENRSFIPKSKWCNAKTAFIENYFEIVTGFKFRKTGIQ